MMSSYPVQINCIQCRKNCSDVEYLKAHISEQHLNWLPYVCRQCDAKLPTFKAFSNHNSENHGGTDEPLVSYKVKILSVLFVSL